MSELRLRAIAGSEVRTVQRLARLLLAGLLLSVPSASPAEAAATGMIRGVVLNGATGEPQASVRVTLEGGIRRASGGVEQTLEQTVVTDSSGRYVFEDLPAGKDRIYTVDGRFEGGYFVGRALSIPDDTAEPPVLDSTLRVWHTTTDPNSIVIERDDIFVVRGESGADVVESFRITNVSDRAYIGRGRALDRQAEGVSPSLSFSFPPQAAASGVQVFESDIDIPELVQTETGIGITAAVPPGETSITFVYSLQGATGRYDLSRRANYPVLNLNVFAADPFVIEAPALEEGEEVTIQGERYRRWSATDAIEPAASLQIAASAPADADPVLVGGAIAAGVALLLAIAGALLLRRRRAPAAARPGGAPETREDLLVAIARLDLAYEAEELGHDEWVERRTRLKAKLQELKAPEHAT